MGMFKIMNIPILFYATGENPSKRPKFVFLYSKLITLSPAHVYLKKNDVSPFYLCGSKTSIIFALLFLQKKRYLC